MWGVEHFGIPERIGGERGGKILMPLVVGVWIFSGTTHYVSIWKVQHLERFLKSYINWHTEVFFA